MFVFLRKAQKLRSCSSASFLLGKSLSDKEADFIVEVSVVYLLILDDFSHLAGVAAPPKIDKDDDAVQEENHTYTKQHNEIGLRGCPGCISCSLDCWG